MAGKVNDDEYTRQAESTRGVRYNTLTGLNVNQIGRGKSKT